MGERGVTFSGGQKQRIAVARAFYSNAGHILLDDCLSAVDSHTATWVFKQCIKGPLAKGRTRIVVTHNEALTAADADLLVTLKDGKVIAAGSPTDLAGLGLFTELDGLTPNDQRNPRNDQDAPTIPKPSVRAEQVQEEKEPEKQENANNSSKDPPATGDGQNDGKTRSRNVIRYLTAMGGWLFWPLLAFFFAAQQFGSIATNWWVRELSNTYVNVGPQVSDDYSGRVSSDMTHPHRQNC